MEGNSAGIFVTKVPPEIFVKKHEIMNCNFFSGGSSCLFGRDKSPATILVRHISAAFFPFPKIFYYLNKTFRLQNSLFFLSFFCCFVLEISMRDAGMCDARIKGSHTRRLSPVPLVILTLVSDLL